VEAFFMAVLRLPQRVFSAGAIVRPALEPAGVMVWPMVASMVSVPAVDVPDPAGNDAAPPLGTPFWQTPVMQMASRGQSEFREHFATSGGVHAADAAASANETQSDLVIRSSKGWCGVCHGRHLPPRWRTVHLLENFTLGTSTDRGRDAS
jgi:hypothetical protein